MADALEGNRDTISICQFAHRSNGIALAGVKHLGGPHLKRLRLARRGHFERDDPGRTRGTGAHDGAQTDGSSADYHHCLAEEAAGLLHRVHANCQRFDQRAGLCWETFR
ncbi:hypothetical protein D3C81_1909180 [compost metagenome]